MLLLLVVSFIWAFSFGLIKGRLAGIDPTAVATLRLVLALLVFAPFLRLRGVPTGVRLKLAAIGALQFGIMYVLYLRAFAHLQAFEVALFTITTPFFVTLLDGALQRRFVATHAIAALLSVVGAGVIVWRGVSGTEVAIGVLLVQASNLCFAAGQIGWRHVRAQLDPTLKDASLFGLLYAGALAASLVASWFTTDWSALRLNGSQIVTLLYLGVLASGLCFFWWNTGATRVNAGTLAVFNNAKIPLAVACSLLFFGEKTDVLRLVIGGTLIAAGVGLGEWRARRTPPKPA
jgi:drug/metabolite transporter (DMT)-like permease